MGLKRALGRLRREEDGEGKKGDEGREVGGRGQPWRTLISTSRAVPQTPPGGLPRLEVGRGGQPAQLRGATGRCRPPDYDCSREPGDLSEESTGAGRMRVPEPVWLPVSTGHTGPWRGASITPGVGSGRLGWDPAERQAEKAGRRRES